MGGSIFPDADGVFSKAPVFNFNDGRVKFNANSVADPNENYGSSSAFLPKFFLGGERPPSVGFFFTGIGSG